MFVAVNLFVVHSEGAESDDARVSMIFQEVILKAQIFTEENRVRMFECAGNESHLFCLGVCEFDQNTCQFGFGSFNLKKEYVTFDTASCV